MGNGPAPFSEIGKKAKDLLSKDYNFDHKLTVTMLADTGLGFIATGLKKDQLFIGDISTQYKSCKTTFDVKVGTNSNVRGDSRYVGVYVSAGVSTTIVVNEYFPGAKASLSFKIPDQKFGKVDIQYLHDRAAVNSSIDLTPTPLLELAATFGTKELTLGGEVGFDSASASFTKCNVGIGYNQHDFSASLSLTDKGESLKASYYHVVNPINGTAVAAEMTHGLSKSQNSFTFGSSHRIHPLTLLKARFSNTGKVGVLCQHEWSPKSLVTLSAEYDPKALRSPSKLGLALALKP